jgi:hypothetical protein
MYVKLNKNGIELNQSIINENKLINIYEGTEVLINNDDLKINILPKNSNINFLGDLNSKTVLILDEQTSHLAKEIISLHNDLFIISFGSCSFYFKDLSKLLYLINDKIIWCYGFSCNAFLELKDILPHTNNIHLIEPKLYYGKYSENTYSNVCSSKYANYSTEVDDTSYYRFIKNNSELKMYFNLKNSNEFFNSEVSKMFYKDEVNSVYFIEFITNKIAFLIKKELSSKSKFIHFFIDSGLEQDEALLSVYSQETLQYSLANISRKDKNYYYNFHNYNSSYYYTNIDGVTIDVLYSEENFYPEEQNSLYINKKTFSIDGKYINYNELIRQKTKRLFIVFPSMSPIHSGTYGAFIPGFLGENSSAISIFDDFVAQQNYLANSKFGNLDDLIIKFINEKVEQLNCQNIYFVGYSKGANICDRFSKKFNNAGTIYTVPIQDHLFFRSEYIEKTLIPIFDNENINISTVLTNIEISKNGILFESMSDPCMALCNTLKHKNYNHIITNTYHSDVTRKTYFLQAPYYRKFEQIDGNFEFVRCNSSIINFDFGVSELDNMEGRIPDKLNSIVDFYHMKDGYICSTELVPRTFGTFVDHFFVFDRDNVVVNFEKILPLGSYLLRIRLVSEDSSKVVKGFVKKENKFFVVDFESSNYRFIEDIEFQNLDFNIIEFDIMN